jgi:GNAT superfamily N-acetyltransferase
MITIKQTNAEDGGGIASMILANLESWAKELNCSRCIVGTDEKLPSAIHLYAKRGYSRIPKYGQYACLGSSVCLSKSI